MRHLAQTHLKRMASSVFSDDAGVDPDNFYRSQPMSYFRLTMHKDNQLATLRALGEFGETHLIPVRLPRVPYILPL